MSQSKHYQVPKDNHPWRRYKNRQVQEATPEELQAARNLPSLYNFLRDIVENWETYQIPQDELTRDYVKLKNVAPDKAAAWLTSFMRRTWGKDVSPIDYL